jgi:hypothetical protein
MIQKEKNVNNGDYTIRHITQINTTSYYSLLEGHNGGIFVISNWAFISPVNREWSLIFFVIREFSITVIRDWHIIYSVNCEMSVIF